MTEAPLRSHTCQASPRREAKKTALPLLLLKVMVQGHDRFPLKIGKMRIWT